MTIVNKSFTVKSKRKEHPNAVKYPGRPSMEFGTAVRNFMFELNDQEMDAFVEGKYVFRQDVSAQFFDSVEENDVIGVGLLKGLNEHGENHYNEPAAYKFKVLDIDKNRDIIKARNVTFESKKNDKYKGTEMELTFEDLSCAFGMGFGEILERDGKPFGVSEEIEIKINIVGNNGEDNESKDENVLPQADPASTPTQTL